MAEKKRREKKENKTSADSVRIAKVVYGTKSLTDCMEAVIKTYLLR